MANYEATTRSNYFRVKDAAAFEAWCTKYGVSFWTRQPAATPNVKEYAITADSGDGSGWPSQRWDDNSEDWEDVDFTTELAAHLAPDNIAILLEIGNDKLRYLVGMATAIHPDGRTATVSLADIYDRAQAMFGADVTITEASW